MENLLSYILQYCTINKLESLHNNFESQKKIVIITVVFV